MYVQPFMCILPQTSSMNLHADLKPVIPGMVMFGRLLFKR